jgi:hypothetical protein
MFASAYMGRKRCFQMLLLYFQHWLLREEYLVHLAKAFEGAAPRRFRPTYAGANVGHPTREMFAVELASREVFPYLEGHATRFHPRAAGAA